MDRLTFKDQIIFYILVFSLAIFIVSNFFVFYINTIDQTNKYIFRANNEFLNKEDYLITEFDRYKDYLSSISNSFIVKNAILKNDINYLNKIFLTRTKDIKNLYILRFVDNNGKEISVIRKDKNHKVKISDLQNKSNRYYIANTKDLKQGQHWYSKIDLNIEYKKIEIPYKSTIRLVFPMYIDGVKRGLIIGNFLVESILERLNQNTIYNIYLVDKDGEFIWYKNGKNDFSWSKYSSNKQNLKECFPNDYVNILKNTEYIGKNIYTHQINFDNQESIKMILEVKDSIVKHDLSKILYILILGFLITLVISVPFIIFISKILNKLISKYKLEEIKRDKQILNQSKLAQMGEMISMIAHQWRQPLAAISATTSNLKLKIKLNNIDAKYFENEITLIDNYSQHLSKTIDDFRGFLHEDVLIQTSTLEDIVKDVLNITNKSLENKNITLQTTFTCNITINTYVSEVKQVVLNLIKNAEDALIYNNIKQPKIFIKTLVKGKNKIIVVEDNAGGIPLNIQDKIYEPYFSTKKKKNGTGLGLYMSKIIIEEHCKGKLCFQSDKKGTLFRIEFKDKIYAK